MPRPRRRQFIAEAFAKRLQAAMEQNPNCPPKYQGERKWLVEQLLKLGVPVGMETIRKWVEGETLPAPDKFPAIAEALAVDVQWLMFGDTLAEAVQPAHSFDAAPLTNLVAGIIGLDGGTVSFPANDDRLRGGAVHLHAVVRGANYPLHIVGGTLGDDRISFRVPAKRDGVIVVGVVRRGTGFDFDIFELDEALIEKNGRYDRGAVVVEATKADMRQVKSFSERL